MNLALIPIVALFAVGLKATFGNSADLGIQVHCKEVELNDPRLGQLSYSHVMVAVGDKGKIFIKFSVSLQRGPTRRNG